MCCGRSQMLSQAQCRARLERIVKKITDSATFLVPQAKWSNAALTKDQKALVSNALYAEINAGFGVPTHALLDLTDIIPTNASRQGIASEPGRKTLVRQIMKSRWLERVRIELAMRDLGAILSQSDFGPSQTIRGTYGVHSASVKKSIVDTIFTREMSNIVRLEHKYNRRQNSNQINFSFTTRNNRPMFIRLMQGIELERQYNSASQSITLNFVGSRHTPDGAIKFLMKDFIDFINLSQFLKATEINSTSIRIQAHKTDEIVGQAVMMKSPLDIIKNVDPLDVAINDIKKKLNAVDETITQLQAAKERHQADLNVLVRAKEIVAG